MITVTIDGKEIRAEKGRTILEIARENNITIPTLCYHKNLFPIGSCRLCIVEVEGNDKPITSCDTVAVDGIKVTTKSDKLFRMRQEYIKFLLIHHPLECPICDAASECDLQDLAFAHKIEKVDLAADKEPTKPAPYATPLIRYSQPRCVLCLRCIHACREVSGRAVLALEGNGIDAHMAPVNPNNCISCGECLFVCPVGALTEQSSPLKSRKWQTRRQLTTCPHCGFGCALTLDVFEDRIITKVISKVDTPPNNGSLCMMGRFGYDFANHNARITTPSIRENGSARACDLTEAVESIAAALAKLNKQGKRSGFIISPRATNEEVSMLLQIAGCFPMSVVGTAGYYHTGRILDAFRERGLSYGYSYGNLAECDLIITAGADLLANNHLLADKVREAVKTNGSDVVVVDPSVTGLTAIANLWLKPAADSDAVLFNALAKELINTKKHDAKAEEITGFSDYKAGLDGLNKQAALDKCSIAEKDFDRLVSLISKAEKIAVIIGSGVSDNDTGLAGLLNLCVLKGIDRKGFIMPTSLQSNAVGAMTILGNVVAPHKILSDPSIGGLFIYEDDPLHYLNGASVEESLKTKSFVAVCDALPTKIADFADITVPTGTFAEKEGTFVAEDGFGRKVARARGTSSPGFEFLKMLLDKTCGGLYHSEEEALAGLYKKEILVDDEDKRTRLVSKPGTIRFVNTDTEPDTTSARPYTLVLRNPFLNHLLSDKEVYSKVVHLNNPPVVGDKLFISAEDAGELSISDGDTVTLESDSGKTQGKATIKTGLRKGVIEYRMMRNRADILKLAQGYRKHITVTLKKG